MLLKRSSEMMSVVLNVAELDVQPLLPDGQDVRIVGQRLENDEWKTVARYYTGRTGGIILSPAEIEDGWRSMTPHEPQPVGAEFPTAHPVSLPFRPDWFEADDGSQGLARLVFECITTDHRQ